VIYFVRPMIYNSLLSKIGKERQIALLIDPDKYEEKPLIKTVEFANRYMIDFILLGGSLISYPVNPVIDLIKGNSSIPVLLFPGSLLQISDHADGILLLSLVSGRNPDFLIGNHIIAAPLLKKSNLEIISTAYILIESGVSTSVEYMSYTKPIPSDKPDIAIATALASEMLGFKLVYLEAGSGARSPVPESIIRGVKQNVTIPVIVGGGIRSKEDAQRIYQAGADIIVIGNAIEKNPELLEEIASIR
jgi:phosphoglycerol geranylgeranyltransferase